jgi:hypothetical protein
MATAFLFSQQHPAHQAVHEVVIIHLEGSHALAHAVARAVGGALLNQGTAGMDRGTID